MQPQAQTRFFRVIAQDPSVKIKEKILTTLLEVPAEDLLPGPWGYRVQVVDYDVSKDMLITPPATANGADPFIDKSDKELLSDPHFHCQNVYALVMKTLARFEYALGRRVSWSFYGHHLKVAPHAFGEANAFYSEQDHALMFGYFPSRDGKETVYSCLSHDIVVHETTHAILDGLRDCFTDPASQDQAAFHEGFADIVALLSVFSMRDIARLVIDGTKSKKKKKGKDQDLETISQKAVTREKLRDSILFGLAEQFGRELQTTRGNALRRSIDLSPSGDYLEQEEFKEAHRRGEILTAAVMNAFLEVWVNRLSTMGLVRKGRMNRDRVVEEGAEIADRLLTILIRAIDYTPPVDIYFSDYLSAVLTADFELYPTDDKYQFRPIILKSFHAYGIDPPPRTAKNEGRWLPPRRKLIYSRSHFEAMQHDPEEVFRFIWENRKALHLSDEAYTRVISVRPCIRLGHDGFMLHETVAECMQRLEIPAGELPDYDITPPENMPPETPVRINGGTTLIFDEWGRLKYSIFNRIKNKKRQEERLKYLWENGMIQQGPSAFKNFAALHLRRIVDDRSNLEEGWK